jgi:hypothetical protein
MGSKVELHVNGNQGQVMVGLDRSINSLYQTKQSAQQLTKEFSSDDIIILPNQSGLQPYYPLFRKHLQEAKSLRHSLQHLLLLADRILIYVQHDFRKKELQALPEQLQQLQENETAAFTIDCDHLLYKAVKQWFETIHLLLYPEKWENNEKRLEEKQIWMDLGLFPCKSNLCLEQKSAELLNLLRAEYFLTDDLTCLLRGLIAPLDQHYYVLRRRLRNVVLLQQPIEDHVCLQILREERELHLQKYVDRVKLLNEITEKLNNNHGQYLLLTGKAGIGKTALISKLSEELASSDKSTVQAAPWLPKIILHYCKQLKTPKEILQTWLTQANLLLVNKLALPNFGMKQNDKQAYQMIRKAMYQILNRLTLECGEIIFLIDALDELAIPLEDLDFLPQTLPDQAKVIISVRKGSQTEDWLRANRKMILYELPPLSRDEIPRFTNLDDEEEKEFHDKLWSASQGWTLYISAAVQELHENGGDPQKVEVNHINYFYEQQLNKWISFADDVDDELRWKILGLLGIFEAACPLSLAEIQSYLRLLKFDVSKQELKSLLVHVGDQISGIQSDSLILQINSFAKYVREQCWTEHEYEENLENIIHWLGTDPDIPIKTIAHFVLYLTSERPAEEQNYYIRKLIDLLKEKDMERLFQVGFYIYLNFGIHPSKIALRFILIPAKLGHLKAIYLMSRLPLQDILENRKWDNLLQRKLQKENTTLADLFRDDPIITKHLQNYYRQAKNPHASSTSLRLLGHKLQSWFRYDEAIIWLRKAAKQNDSIAMFQLGDLLTEHGHTKKQIKEGYQWLERAAEAGEKTAMFLLGCYLIEGNHFSMNVEKGEEWLRKAAQSGYKPAQKILHSRTHKKLRKLRKKAQEGNIWAICVHLFLIIEICSHQKLTFTNQWIQNYRDTLPWLYYTFFRLKFQIKKFNLNLMNRFFYNYSLLGLHYKILFYLLSFIQNFLFLLFGFSVLFKSIWPVFLSFLLPLYPEIELYLHQAYYCGMGITVGYQFLRIMLNFFYRREIIIID